MNNLLICSQVSVRCSSFVHSLQSAHSKTRKLSYRKDNPAMRPRPLWVPGKISGVPDYADSYISWNFKWAFVPIDPLNVRTKFEAHSFTRSWNNRGYSKTIWAVSGSAYAHAPFPPKFLMDGSYEDTGQIWSP